MLANSRRITEVNWRSQQPHCEIRLKADGSYAVMPPSENPSGNRYEHVNGMLSTVILSKHELMQLIATLKQKNKSELSSRHRDAKSQTHRINDKQISRIVSLIRPCYHLGLRNDLVMYLAGWLLKECVTIDDARKIIEGIYEQDEEKDARVRTLEETYKKEDPNNVKGYSGLLEVLTSELRDERQAHTLLDELQNALHDDRQKDSDQEAQKSIIEEASEAIMSKHRLLTIEETREIWYYRGGVYVPGGEILIEKEAEMIYGFNIANHHLSEIKGHIMRRTYRYS